MKERLARLGIEPAGGTPAQFSAMLEKDRHEVEQDHHRTPDQAGPKREDPMKNFDFHNPYPTTRIPVFARNAVSTSHPLAAGRLPRCCGSGATRWMPPSPPRPP